MFKVDGEYVYNERQILEFTHQQLRSEKAKKAGIKSAKAREEKKAALQKIKQQHFADANGRCLQAELNSNSTPTLHTSSSTSTSICNSIEFAASKKDVFEWWNRIAKSYGHPTITSITTRRMNKFRTREKEGLWDRRSDIEEAVKNFGEFARGAKWFTFDWLVKNSENWMKAIDGNYIDKSKKDIPKIVIQEFNLEEACK
jgi:arginine/lysine/ornithine decarboxylase